MRPTPHPLRRHFTEAARAAALAARRTKMAEPDRFGLPELFIVKAGERSFTWELRRFGGVVLQRAATSFASMAPARAEGEAALAALLEAADQPTFRRQTMSRAGQATCLTPRSDGAVP